MFRGLVLVDPTFLSPERQREVRDSDVADQHRRVLGLERFDLVHEYGSSHGLTRIIRLAYWEHPTYVALLRRSYELWRELESESGEQLLYITGSVDAGPPGSSIFQGALRSSELHGLPHEVMDGAELHRRFPGYGLPRTDRKSTRLNSSHVRLSRMPSSA